MPKSLWYGVCGLLAVCVIMTGYLSIRPSDPEADGGLAIAKWIAERVFGSSAQADKVQHCAAYGAIGFLGVMAWAAKKGAIRIFLAALLYGAGLELVQAFLPSRDPSFADLLANAVGAAGGAALALAIPQHMRAS